ncbi:hypothetical protein WICPIJ_004262, partial [Wickerhamomyces pijperi]
DENRTCESKLWSVDPSVLGNADKTKEIYSGLEKTIKKQSIDHEDVEKLAIFNMKVLKFQKAYADTEEMFQKSLMTVYYRWTARRLKQDEQESLQQGVFQFSDPTLDAEKEFQQLFPDADIELTGDGSNINWDHIYSQIASSYCNYFL